MNPTSKWTYTRVNWEIVMIRINYNKQYIEQRDMTKWERFKYPFWRLLFWYRKL